VLPDYRGQGIWTEWARPLLHKLSGLYMVDVMCGPDSQPFYASGNAAIHGNGDKESLVHEAAFA